MERLLRRYVWVIDLFGIGIGAALAGHATALLLGGALASAGMPSRRAPRPVRPAVTTTDKSIEAIVGRNMFCSSCDGTPAPSRRPLRLLAIMFAPPPNDPRWSLAIVRDEEAATTGPYGVGARLGGATIDAIEDVRVVLDVGRGRRDYLELLSPRPPDGRRARADTIADGVRKTGAHSYEVPRGLLDQFLAGGVAPPWPRIVPQTRGGAPVGFQLFGVRADGPFAALGLASGDLLLQANGQSLATPTDALAAFTALRTASHVWLLVERDGQRVRFDYAIR